MTKHGCNATEWIATAQFITRKDSEKVFQIRERFRRANESSMCVRQRVELIRWPEQRGRRRHARARQGRKASDATLSNHLRRPRVPAALVNWEQSGCVTLSRCEDADEETLCTCAEDKSDDAKPSTVLLLAGHKNPHLR